jgi:hypothetical protein
MEPSQPTTTTPKIGQSFVEYIRTNRQNVGIVLATLAVLFLGFTVFLAIKGFRSTPGPEKTPDKSLKENPLDPQDKPELPRTADVPGRGQYHLGWIGCLLAFLITAAWGSWLMAGPSPPTEGEQRTEARYLILGVGGLLGAVLIFVGIVYFYLWSESLSAWLSKGDVSQSMWVIIPIMMIALGAGLVVMAAQPARAEERNNTLLRQLVYGSNLALTVLLLLVVLVVANVLFAIRVPNELDTTSSGFYSISDETRNLLQRLDPPVTAYAVLPDDIAGRHIEDMRQLLVTCEAASNGKFKVKFLGTVANRREVADLQGRYPQLDLILADRMMGQAGAIVLTTGADEKRHVVIPVRELFTQRGLGFAGESRLAKELTLLADNQTKPVIYFTQSNGELSIMPGEQAPDDEKAERLRLYLEKNYLDVRPLTFKPTNPSVPEDAAVVVVAGPKVPFSEPAVAALRKYMTTPQGPDGKKGKLLVLAGAVPGPGGKGVMKTGLEGLLAELNVRLGDKFVYAVPRRQTDELRVPWVRFSPIALANRQPIAVAIQSAQSSLPMPEAREVSPPQLAANQALKPAVLLVAPDVTWLEDDPLPLKQEDLENYLRNLFRNDDLMATREMGKNRPFAVTVSEGTTARLAVYGSSLLVSDLAARDHPPESAPITFDLVGVTVDWLRERPSVAAVNIKDKQYQVYEFPLTSSVDDIRLLYLPLALGLLVIVGLGVGVWLIRRK